MRELETRLAHEPEDMFLRLMLMGHYFHTGEERFLAHAQWLTERHPELDLLWRFKDDPKRYQKALEVWFAHLNRHF